jgi:hypothetical protein
MSKNRKKPQTQRLDIPFNRFHSDEVREDTKEARRRARDEAAKYKNKRYRREY